MTIRGCAKPPARIVWPLTWSSSVSDWVTSKSETSSRPLSKCGAKDGWVYHAPTLFCVKSVST